MDPSRIPKPLILIIQQFAKAKMSDDAKDAASAPSPPAQPHTESQPQNKPDTEPEKSREETLKQARIFLQDEAVQKFTPQERVEFLKSKGVSENDIQELLKEVATQAAEPAALPTPAMASAPERTVSRDRSAFRPNHKLIIYFADSG